MGAPQPVPGFLDPVDRRVTHWMARHGLTLLRVAVGVIFVWFGALKLFPGVSPAETLITGTFPFVPARLFVPALGVWEILIGLGYLSGRMLRLTIALMLAQMAGAVSPLFLNPIAAFVQPPFVLTLEGQYIIKNIVLLAAAVVIGATVRGGRLTARPPSGDG